ncbi:helix-turn-helix domain-containing protein [Paraburkholderia sp. MPAMCS5]|uniref:TetR/AcrR family transcriptional regulator n=1 Tax=Paraburkholderia sp. MPAMCS5 TaxID=3112563 RepID=UPI002E190F18|nr:helix-turn-helix domain-containing protein [Paraburkholderia sp. MPAMCS5]
MIKNTTESAHAREMTLGVRERNKLEKRDRIMAAARAMFIEKGYEAATTREIAIRAEVAIGTVFVYAKDKRDLLLMIVNDDLDAVNSRTFADIDVSAPLLDQVMAFYRKRYQYWATEPRISRAAVQETFDYLSVSPGRGAETLRFYARRSHVMSMLSELISARQRAGEISTEHPANLIASLLMTIYLTEVRRWLAATENPDVRTGLAHLRKMLSLAMSGIYGARQ